MVVDSYSRRSSSSSGGGGGAVVVPIAVEGRRAENVISRREHGLRGPTDAPSVSRRSSSRVAKSSVVRSSLRPRDQAVRARRSRYRLDYIARD